MSYFIWKILIFCKGVLGVALKIVVWNIGYMLKISFSVVRYNNGKGEEWKINKGLRQGWIISPLLFTFYIKGCFEDMVNYDVGCRIVLIKWNELAYADITVLMTPSLRFREFNW